jgi:ABC-2 type transport system permease protein
MRLNLNKVLIIARREYLTTVRRKAFVVTLLLTPAIFFFAGVVSTKMQISQAVAKLNESRIVAVVDSSGLYANAPLTFDYTAPAEPNLDPRQAGKPVPQPKRVPVIFRHYADQKTALDSLEAGNVKSVLVVSSDFLTSGRLRVYEKDTRTFTNSGDLRPITNWLSRNLLAGTADSLRIERTLWMGRALDYYTKDRDGRWAVKDDAKELAGFLLPFALSFLLAMAIITGGQYLLQGVSEEKESRILESMLCSVTPGELLGGKMLGLGGAGLTLVGVWILAGAFTSAGVLSFIHVSVPASLLVLGLLYFLFGYIFYASIMMSVGSLTSNLREATQFSGYLTILNVCPFWAMVVFINTPNSPIAVGMSLFPPTAATSMMLRMSASAVSGAVIPPWQIAVSLGLLGLSGVFTLMLGSKLFRLGMLLYGKTPNLPEIMRILRQP